MFALIEKLRTVAAQTKSKQSSTYGEFVKAVASGKEIDPTKILSACDAAAKTVDDFERDVAATVQRIELRAKADAIPRVNSELAKIDEQIAAHDAELRKAEAAHDAKIAPLHGRRAELARLSAEGEKARSALFLGCSSNELREKLADIAQQGKVAEESRKFAQNELHRLNELVAARKYPSGDPMYAAQNVDIEERTTRMRAQIRQANQDAARLEAERELVEEQMRQA